MSTPERPQRNDRELSLLHHRVTLARRDLQLGRAMSPSPHRAEEQLRRAHLFLDVLQAYADATVVAGVPLPYRYRDELRLYRSLYP